MLPQQRKGQQRWSESDHQGLSDRRHQAGQRLGRIPPQKKQFPVCLSFRTSVSQGSYHLKPNGLVRALKSTATGERCRSYQMSRSEPISFKRRMMMTNPPVLTVEL